MKSELDKCYIQIDELKINWNAIDKIKEFKKVFMFFKSQGALDKNEAINEIEWYFNKLFSKRR